MYGTIQTGKCMFEGAIRDSLALGTFLFTFYRIQMVEGWNCRPREGRSGGGKGYDYFCRLEEVKAFEKASNQALLML